MLVTPDTLIRRWIIFNDGMIPPDLPMKPANTQRFYYPELDGLRFIAFLLVFIHNANPILKGTFLDTFSAYSWYGVDLFFCLSAFLITKLLLTECQRTGKINIRNFYIRRMLRIWPLYFFYIVVGAVIMFPMQGRNINIPGHLASLATFTFNFGYFALLPSPILIFIHLWSVSYEEQFYAVIPWILRRLSQIKERSVWITVGIAYLLGSMIRATFIYLQFRHPVVRFLPITNFDSILAGMILGLGLLDRSFDKTRSDTLFLMGILSLGAVYLLPNNDVVGWNLMLTYPLTGLGTLLITASIIPKTSGIFHTLLGNPVFVYLGKISYGLYIFHFGVFALTVSLLSRLLGVIQLPYPRYTLPVLLLSFLITFVFSFLSYNLIEKPFLRWKDKFGSISVH